MKTQSLDLFSSIDRYKKNMVLSNSDPGKTMKIKSSQEEVHKRKKKNILRYAQCTKCGINIAEQNLSKLFIITPLETQTLTIQFFILTITAR